MKRILMVLLAVALICPRWAKAEDIPTPKKGPVGIAGWIDFTDPNSIASFEKHADQIDRVYMYAYRIQADGMPHPIDAATPELKARVLAIAARNNVQVWINSDNFNPALGQDEKQVVEKMTHDGKLREQHAQALVNYAVRDGVRGIQVAYLELDDNIKGIKNRGEFKDFIDKLNNFCKPHNLLCGVEPKYKENRDGNGGEAYDYPGFGGTVYQIIPKSDDQNPSIGVACPRSSPEYAESCAIYVGTVMNPIKMLLAVPNSGNDWIKNHQVKITQQEFSALAQKYNVKPRRDINYSQEVSINYTDAQGKEHTAWMIDNRCLELYCDLVKKYRLYGIAIRNLGGETDSYWETLKKVNASPLSTSNLLPPEPPPAALTKLNPIELFTNIVSNGSDTYAYPVEGDVSARHGGSHYFIINKNGKRWADIQLEGDAWAGGAIGCPVIDISPYVEKGALQFFVRGMHGDEMMNVGFETQKTVKERLVQYGFVNTVPITNYCRVTTEWQKVVIPLSDFKNTAESWSDRQGQTVYSLFRWNRITAFEYDIAPTADPDFHVQFAGIVVMPTYDAKDIAKQKESMQ